MKISQYISKHTGKDVDDLVLSSVKVTNDINSELRKHWPVNKLFIECNDDSSNDIDYLYYQRNNNMKPVGHNKSYNQQNQIEVNSLIKNNDAPYMHSLTYRHTRHGNNYASYWFLNPIIQINDQTKEIILVFKEGGTEND